MTGMHLSAMQQVPTIESEVYVHQQADEAV